MAVYRGWLEEHATLPMEGAKPCSRNALEAGGWLRLPDEGERRTLEGLRAERACAAASRNWCAA